MAMSQISTLMNYFIDVVDDVDDETNGIAAIRLTFLERKL